MCLLLAFIWCIYLYIYFFYLFSQYGVALIWYVSPIWDLDQFKYLSWYFTSLYNALIWYIWYISPVWILDQFRNQFCIMHLYGIFHLYGFMSSSNTYPSILLVYSIRCMVSLLLLSCLVLCFDIMVSLLRLSRL